MRLILTLLMLLTATSYWLGSASAQCQTGYRAPIYPKAAVPCHAPVAYPHHAPAVVVVKEIIIPADYAFQYIPVLLAPPPQPAPPAPQGSPATQGTLAQAEMIFRLPGDSAPQASASGSGGIAILQNRCASCHTGNGKGGVTLFDASGNYAPNVAVEQLKEACRSGRMPKGGLSDPNKRLSASELALVESLTR